MVFVFNTRVSYNSVEYPDWMIDIGWCSCFTSLLAIPLYMGYRLLYIEEGDLPDVSCSFIRNKKKTVNIFNYVSSEIYNPFQNY